MSKQSLPDASTSNKCSPFHSDDASRRNSLTTATSASELACTKVSLQAALRQFPDFPTPGINFVDIMPLFSDPKLHTSLIRALELQVQTSYDGKLPDIIVGLDARGFLFGPSLALRLGAGFAPVRKRDKLPGPTFEASYVKEYGADHFQIQIDAIKKGQSVLIVDDIIATGGSAQAAGKLVEDAGGIIIGYLFILEIEFLKGCDKLNAPTSVLLSESLFT
ncbi:Adenine phosphoribosyltransferase [Golovinomyces cichoracearum]|uniref:adenine phosphoribosyltransferase n=1 Tax=Golovinomyces cichoracearum TaxID=62708 RepID=A0A420ID68_9PEZI|nr:Adenine phosphoribosyltransferase [Golovinomyces cichoracearum]